MKRVLLAAIIFAAMTVAAFAERRVALVFSADNYKTVRPLKNAGNDGLAMKAALEALDFEVFLETDRDLRRMRRALDDFREDASGADVALVFFSGHGVEIAGENRLLPVDADPSSLDALKASTLPLEEIHTAVAAIAKIGLIVIDACRNDPFGLDGADASSRAIELHWLKKEITVVQGLGRMGRSENTLYAFSAAPGQTASDGNSGNSPFTAALAKYLGTDGLEIRSVLTLVQQEVYDFSQGQQLPYVESGLPRLFFAAARDTELPERERLLLAMADINPAIRDQIENIAVQRGMPLAPLYGALISSNASSLSSEDRRKKLVEAADAFVKVRNEMRSLASDDPQVTELRQKAERQLSLGAFDAARARLEEAAGIDAKSRQALKSNFVERTLSEAATHYLSGGAARADLRYQLAIADYEKVSALFAEVDGEDIPADARLQQIMSLEALGGLHVTVGDLAQAELAYETLHRVTSRRAMSDPGNADWQRDLSVSHSRIGDLRMAQGDLAGALSAYEAGLAIAESLSARDAGNTLWQLDLAISHGRIGGVRAAQGDLAAALSAYEANLAIAESLAARNPDNAEWQRDLSVSQDNIGGVRVAQGNLAGALDAYEASMAIAAQLAETDPGNADWQRDLSISHEKIGDVRVAQGNLSGAFDAYEASLMIRTRLAENDPGNAGWQRDMTIGYSKIGEVRVAQGDLQGALDAFQSSLDIATKLASSDPGNADWQRDLSVGHSKVGDLRVAQGDLPEALDAYEASLAITKGLAIRDPGNAGWQRDLSVSHNKIGDLRVAQADLPGALDAYEAGLVIAARLAETDPDNAGWWRDLSVSHNKIGNVRVAQGNLPEALNAYEASLAIRETLAARDPGNARWQRDLSISYSNIGDVREAQGDLPGARDAYEASLAIRERLAASDPGNAGWQRDLLVSHYNLAQAGGDAKLHLGKALELAEELEQTGRLAPSDSSLPAFFRQEIRKLELAAK